MKKLTLIIIVALMIGVAMAKPPTKQEKKAQKQEQTEQYAEELRQMLLDGQFRLVDPKWQSAYTGMELQVCNKGKSVAFYLDAKRHHDKRLDYSCEEADYKILLNTEHRIIVYIGFTCERLRDTGYIGKLDGFTIDCNLKDPTKNSFTLHKF